MAWVWWKHLSLLGINSLAWGYLSYPNWCTIQFINRYTVVQLQPKRSLLHRNNIRDFHTRTPNEKFLAFSPSDYSVSILTSSPLLSCHSGSTATADNDVIVIFQDGGRGRSILLLLVSYLLMLRSKSIISSTSMVNIISIYGWDITTSGLENKCPPYWNSTSGFDLD